jgi:hypothetical protein
MSIKTILVISMIIVAVNADIVFLNEDAKKTCPKNSCKSANSEAAGTCVKAKGKITESRTVEVSTCKTDEACPASSVLDSLVGDSDVDLKCTKTTTPAPSEGYALPGEACVADKKQCKGVAYYNDKDEKVENKDGTCTNNVCVGSLEGKKCDSLEACDLKFFCSGIEKDAQGVVTKSGTCKVLLKKDAEGCKRSKECEAGLICLSFTKDTTTTNKCSDINLLEIGTEVKLASAEDASLKNFACKSGLVNPTTSKCSEYKYDAEASKIADGKVKCTPGELCKYNYFIKEEKTAGAALPCQCAFDASGSGYCPYSSHDAVVIDRFNSINKINLENWKRTGVHPEHRDLENNTDVSKGKSCLSVYRDVRYSKSVDCFKTVLGADTCKAISSVSYISYSLFAIFAVLAMFF